MSDIVTLTSTETTPIRPRRRGLRVLVAVVTVVGLVAALLLVVDARSRAIRDETALASHNALVAASSAWPGMWDQLELAPGDRNIDAITGAASVGVPTTGGTYVSTGLVANNPHSIGVVITVQSDGIVTYVAQAVRRNPLDGSASSDSGGCNEGEMHDGMACRDWVENLARRWQI